MTSRLNDPYSFTLNTDDVCLRNEQSLFSSPGVDFFASFSGTHKKICDEISIPYEFFSLLTLRKHRHQSRLVIGSCVNSIRNFLFFPFLVVHLGVIGKSDQLMDFSRSFTSIENRGSGRRRFRKSELRSNSSLIAFVTLKVILMFVNCFFVVPGLLFIGSRWEAQAHKAINYS